MSVGVLTENAPAQLILNTGGQTLNLIYIDDNDDLNDNLTNVEKVQMAFAASFIDMIWYTFVSLIVGNSLIRKNFKNTKVLNKISTVILVFISIYILVKIFT